MSEQNIETTRRGYEAFAAGDLQEALSVFDNSVEWTINGDSMIGGTYRGKAELTGLMLRLAEKSTHVEPKRFLSDGDVVMVLAEVSAAGETAWEADVYTFANGKIVQAQVFGDTAVQERIFGSKGVTAG
ncbi:MAG TPA: nuclear transport factor 2 family protein [Mycobacterium sp.]|nr:nuclear transport factor 2 family protein [Mycobacterium sp.]HTX94251.1 nuclear transport factor 2 family protein [Mycobacterium sp.]